MDLLDDDPRDAGQADLKVNESFAAKYEAKKRREELGRLQDKYGQAGAGEDEDDSDYESTVYSSEDSDAEFVTPQVDAAIFKIIGKIRKGDTEIYTAAKKDFFDEEEKRLAEVAKAASKQPSKQRQSRKEKPVHLRDYQRKALLATGGKDDDDDDTLNGLASGSSANAHGMPTPAEEQRALREETKAAFLNAFSGSEDSDDSEGDGEDFLRRRDAGEESDDEDQYRKFLLDNVGEEEVERALAIRRKEAAASGAQGDGGTEEDFLKNYILNRGWLDKKSKRLPTYADIVVETDATKAVPAAEADGAPSGANAVQLMEDSDDEFERAEEFETKYNFRFEEAAGNEIQTHARDVGTSIRREDDSRKQAREARKARKAAEKQERMEELKRLKNLKKQEIMDRIAKIKAVAGVDDEGIDVDALDLEAEYDPSQHDAQMARVFNDRFYGDLKTDADGKPVWEDDIDISDIVPEAGVEEEEEAYDPSAPGRTGKKSRAERKREKMQKKKGKGKAAVQEVNGHDDDYAVEEEEGTSAHGGAADIEFDAAELDAIVDPEERKRLVERYMDEYYKLDYEDMIGDMPTRFHYTSTQSLNPLGSSQDDYALTPAEILMATDAELNEYESLRKLAPYRNDASSVKANKRRKKLKELRKRIAARRWGEELPDDDEVLPITPSLRYKAPGGERSEAAGSSKRKDRPHQAENGIVEGERPAKKKRLGAKQRKRAKAKESAVTEQQD